MVILFLEIFAVSSAILYLILAAKEDIRCWYAALFSSILYMYIMHTAGLIMESFLQIFYIFQEGIFWLEEITSIGKIYILLDLLYGLSLFP